jgi:hypothetical protein
MVMMAVLVVVTGARRQAESGGELRCGLRATAEAGQKKYSMIVERGAGTWEAGWRV